VRALRGPILVAVIVFGNRGPVGGRVTHGCLVEVKMWMSAVADPAHRECPRGRNRMASPIPHSGSRRQYDNPGTKYFLALPNSEYYDRNKYWPAESLARRQVPLAKVWLSARCRLARFMLPRSMLVLAALVCIDARSVIAADGVSPQDGGAPQSHRQHRVVAYVASWSVPPVIHPEHSHTSTLRSRTSTRPDGLCSNSRVSGKASCTCRP